MSNVTSKTSSGKRNQHSRHSKNATAGSDNSDPYKSRAEGQSKRDQILLADEDAKEYYHAGLSSLWERPEAVSNSRPADSSIELMSGRGGYNETLKKNRILTEVYNLALRERGATKSKASRRPR